MAAQSAVPKACPAVPTTQRRLGSPGQRPSRGAEAEGPFEAPPRSTEQAQALLAPPFPAFTPTQQLPLPFPPNQRNTPTLWHQTAMPAQTWGFRARGASILLLQTCLPPLGRPG